ncbi:MAG: 50S ribosomal protein L25/general stress protein Ctc, partial [Pseudomonadota bacterium]|nr:50S ribosomal protein L25/general stress protein Ctc [Pseudomonadota bacterium]
ITLEQRDITKLYNSGRLMSTLIQIDVDGEKTRAITRDVQLHPVKDFILHADFLRLGKGAKIAVEIPVNFLNEDSCPGLKQGGVLNVVRYQVELNCPASEIPESIELDLAEANIGDSLHISDVKLPEGVVPTIADRDFTIATIAAPAGLDDTDDEVEEGIEGEEGDEGDSNEEGEE